MRTSDGALVVPSTVLDTAFCRSPEVESRWDRVRAGIARGGLEYVATAASSFVPPQLLRYEHHRMLACTGAVRGSRTADAATSIFPILSDTHDVERLSGHGNLTRETVERRLGRGDVCVMICEGPRVVASAWAATGTRYLIGMGRVFAIPRDAFYIFDTFTEPDVRRRGLATACYEALFDRLAVDGRRTGYAAVGVLNHPSLAAHASWGFRAVGRSRKLCLPGLTVTLCPRWPRRSRWLRLEVWRGYAPCEPA